MSPPTTDCSYCSKKIIAHIFDYFLIYSFLKNSIFCCLTIELLMKTYFSETNSQKISVLSYFKVRILIIYCFDA